MPQEHSSEPGTGAWCPNCGRFVGPREVCDHCGGRVPKAVTLRVARYGALALAVIGLSLLWVAARHSDAPVVRVADVQSTMNWAYVRLIGTMAEGPSYDEQSGALSFWIDDGSGEAMVTAYRTQSQALLKDSNVPSIGDLVTVEGTLRLREGFCVLTVNIPERLLVQRPKAIDLAIKEVSTAPLLQKVRVRGQVLDRRQPYLGLTVLTVRDQTGQIDVTYTSDLVQLSGSPLQVGAGDFVQVRGAVTRYGQLPQIALEAAEALELLPEGVELGTHVAIGEIDHRDVGDRVQVEAVVTEARQISGGRVFLLDDGTGTIALLLWSDLLAEVEGHDALRPGAPLSALGVVSEYRGDLELVPELGLDVRVSTGSAMAAVESPGEQANPSATREPTSTPLSFSAQSTPTALPSSTAIPTASPSPSLTPTALPSPSATPTALPTATATPFIVPTATALPTETPLPGMPTLSTGQVTAAYLQQEVRIEGRVVEARALSLGVQFWVDDGSGRAMVWMPPEVYEQLASPGDWILGSAVRIEGLVQYYQEQIEIVPRAVDGLKVVSTAVPSDHVVAIGALTAAQVGQRVTVQGQITEERPFSRGMQYLLDDGSGQITLLLWQNVYDVVPHREGLTSGTTVRVTGVVNEYQGMLEVVPDVGGDVIVERPAQ